LAKYGDHNEREIFRKYRFSKSQKSPNFKRLMITIIFALMGQLPCAFPFVIFGPGNNLLPDYSLRTAPTFLWSRKESSESCNETTQSTQNNVEEFINSKEATTAKTEIAETESNVPDPALASLNKNDPKSIQKFSSFSATETPLLADLLADPPEKNGEPPMAWHEQSSELVVSGLAVIALSGILGNLLSDYEWIQTLRYFWPLSLGVYYGMLWNHYNESDDFESKASYEEFGPGAARSSASNKHPLLQLGYIVGGLGLFVGGLADALLPVYITGPNLLTNAGLAPDCAILLLTLSVGEHYGWIGGGRKVKTTTTRNEIVASTYTTLESRMPLLLKVVLWAELYKLGEGSIDEVVSTIQTALLSTTAG